MIKPLGKMFRKVECVSGSSILGTGEVALILDVGVLVRAGRLAQRLGTRAGDWRDDSRAATEALPLTA